MRRHLSIVWVLAMLVLAGPALGAGWTSPRGGPGMPGTVEFDHEPLDVVTVAPALIEHDIGTSFPQILETPQGLLLLEADRGLDAVVETGSEECTLTLIVAPDVGGLRTRSLTEPFDCLDGADLVNYIPQANEALACIDGPADQELLVAFDAATGTRSWAIAPDVPLAVSGAGDFADWSCDYLMVDDVAGHFVVLFTGEDSDHRVQAHDLATQELLWSSSVPATVYSPITNALPAPSGSEPTIDYGQMGMSSTGVVVAGELGTGANLFGRSDLVRHIAWLNAQGEVVGGRTFDVPCSAAEEEGRISQAFAARNNVVALLVCDRLLLIDPALGVTAETVLDVTPSSQPDDHASVAWSREMLVVPERKDLHLFANVAPAEPAGSWPGPTWGHIADVVLTDGAAYVLVASDATQGGAELVRVDLPSATAVQRLPIAQDGLELLTPWRDGLLAFSQDGDVVLFGAADPALVPSVTVPTRYPAVGETLAVDVGVGPVPPVELLVAWGDGLVESVSPEVELARSYEVAGDTVLRVTAVYDDGRTGTAEVPVFVGRDPPRELNAIQKAFDRDNQDLTFGILGIALALTGGAIAAGRSRARRRRVQRELDAIDAAYATTRERPLECEAALAERRAHVRGLGIDGKLDQSEVMMLERHVDELAQRLRLDSIDEQFPFLPVSMARTLREMLADGRISAWEREHLLEALERDEHLTKAQKGKVERQIDAWFARDEGGAA